VPLFAFVSFSVGLFANRSEWQGKFRVSVEKYPVYSDSLCAPQ
jgi:hypothetical protein